MGGHGPILGRRDLQRKGPCQLPVGSGRPDPGQEALRFLLCLQASLALVALPCQGGDGPLPAGEAVPTGSVTRMPRGQGGWKGSAAHTVLSGSLGWAESHFLPVASSETMLILHTPPRVRGPDPQSPLRPQGTVTCAHHGDGTKPLTQSAKPQ